MINIILQCILIITLVYAVEFLFSDVIQKAFTFDGKGYYPWQFVLCVMSLIHFLVISSILIINTKLVVIFCTMYAYSKIMKRRGEYTIGNEIALLLLTALAISTIQNTMFATVQSPTTLMDNYNVS